MKKTARPRKTRLSLFKNPLTVLYYFSQYAVGAISGCTKYVLPHLNSFLLAAVVAVFSYLALSVDGPYKTVSKLLKPLLQVFEQTRQTLLWYSWWLLLGVASSIGMGTGLHTFVLFLGPHVAKVTLNAYQCGNLDFAVCGIDE